MATAMVVWMAALALPRLPVHPAHWMVGMHKTTVAPVDDVATDATDAATDATDAATQQPKPDAEANQQQAEAAIAQVEADVQKMNAFAVDVKRDLAEQEKVRQGITHALGSIRQQEELAQAERDTSSAKVQRLEAEVASLQRTIQHLEEDKKKCANDKETLEEANRKMLAQVNSIFQYGQAVQTGLAFKGLGGANDTSVVA